MEVLKVSSKSAPNSVAGAIAGVIRESGCVEVQAVGAGDIWLRRVLIWSVSPLSPMW